MFLPILWLFALTPLSSKGSVQYFKHDLYIFKFLNIVMPWKLGSIIGFIIVEGLTACTRCFFCTKWWPLKTYEKCFLFHRKRFFRSQEIQIFVFLPCTLFPPVNHCLKRWLKINPKVYDVINWSNKNSETHIAWYLEKQTRSDIETWSIDRVLNK